MVQGLVTRSASSVGTADTVDPISLVKEHPTRPIFPWRHEKVTSLLPRIDPKSKEYEQIVPFPTPQSPFACLFLGVPMSDAIFFGNWKHELTQNMTYAFIQALSGVISNVYRIQPSKTLINDETVTFSFPVEENSTGDEETNDEEHKKFSNRVEDMVGRPLRNLFQSAHESGRDQLRVILETKPVYSTFFRLYAVPFHTRRQVEENPSLIKTLYNNGKPEWNTLFDTLQSHTLELLERDGAVDTTIVAEVCIFCDEKFQVLDAETGVVLQGPEGVPATQRVLHMVTFEMTSTIRVAENFPYFKTEPGNWHIIDIDDLVSTKKWYHIP